MTIIIMGAANFLKFFKDTNLNLKFIFSLVTTANCIKLPIANLKE